MRLTDFYANADYFFGFKSGYIDYYRHTDGAGLPDLFENARRCGRRAI